MEEHKERCERCEKEFSEENFQATKDPQICLDCYTSEIDAAYDQWKDAQ